MACVKFKYADERFVFHKLINQINILCVAKGKDCTCTSGFRSIDKQKIINAQVVTQRKSQGAYQLSNGAVYTGTGANRKCWASAYGQSNHCFCIAMDIDDEWFKALSNVELKKYGLIKPMDYEPWHVQLLEHQGISQEQKEQIRDNVLNGMGDDDMTVKDFQTITGITADGIVGNKTKEKAKEMLQCCQEILGCNYKNATDAINGCMSSTGMWLNLMSKTKYFDSFVMNIVNKMSGK